MLIPGEEVDENAPPQPEEYKPSFPALGTNFCCETCQKVGESMNGNKLRCQNCHHLKNAHKQDGEHICPKNLHSGSFHCIDLDKCPTSYLYDLHLPMPLLSPLLMYFSPYFSTGHKGEKRRKKESEQQNILSVMFLVKPLG